MFVYLAVLTDTVSPRFTLQQQNTNTNRASTFREDADEHRCLRRERSLSLVSD
uniref:Uncharacterized protein n=1 Tax=Anguilla anguilla TaxID=7936 RepID=A0A0E9QAC7_ANGAN